MCVHVHLRIHMCVKIFICIYIYIYIYTYMYMYILHIIYMYITYIYIYICIYIYMYTSMFLIQVFWGAAGRDQATVRHRETCGTLLWPHTMPWHQRSSWQCLLLCPIFKVCVTLSQHALSLGHASYYAQYLQSLFRVMTFFRVIIYVMASYCAP